MMDFDQFRSLQVNQCLCVVMQILKNGIPSMSSMALSKGV